MRKHEKAFESFVARLQEAFSKHMQVDGLQTETAMKIVRPAGRVTSRREVPKPANAVDADPVFHGYGHEASFFYAWLWSEHCFEYDIHCHDVTLVDPDGAALFQVDSEGFQATENDALNVETEFVMPDGYEPVPEPAPAPATATSSSVSSTQDSGSGGWLSSLFDSLSEADWTSFCGGGGCGGDSSCGGGCGGE